jgi:hypothetical protein
VDGYREKRVKFSGGPCTVRLCHLGSKFRVFEIWVPQLGGLCHLGPKLKMSDILILNLHNNVI